MLNKRDKTVLKKIVEYCDDIKVCIAEYGDTPEAVESKRTFRHAVSMCILQIGELSTHLSAGFIRDNPQVPWKNIRGMRNIAAHHYGQFDFKIIHDTITRDVPTLREYCVKWLEENCETRFDQ